jgi:hypothetical protein
MIRYGVSEWVNVCYSIVNYCDEYNCIIDNKE